MYNFDKSACEMLYSEIDGKYVKDFLTHHLEIENEDHFEMRIKEALKYESTFAGLTAILNISSRELISNLYVINPSIFSHYIVRKLKEFV
jgi:hypothetical protein